MAPRSGRRPDHPGPLSDPPAALAKRSLPIIVDRGPWFRSHRTELGAIFFGRSRQNRFDDPERRFGVLYVAADVECAFIETVGPRLRGDRVAAEFLASRVISTVSSARPLRLVDLRGPGLIQIGADARLVAGEHRVAQRWARALFAHPDQPDGILYPARHDPSRASLAIFERPSLDLWPTEIGLDVIGRVLATYRLRIVDE